MQQKVNADVIADVGGGWVMMQDGFTPEALATRLETLFALDENLENAAKKAGSVGQPEATKNLAKLIKSLAKN
jgi:UDP-N-acetylglucosamine--N-acetylmuramyl-(pentapeptide) pyrophosphoryl-undecaprenol N-acetylglucosamine transferase